MKDKKPDKEKKGFTITKKIAKHGSQAIVIIPRILEGKLKPGTLIELKIDVLEEAK
jgi:hypothetical protein